MTRADAYDLMCRHTPSDALRRHMLGVEACMRHYAEKLGEPVETWGLAGLLHDFDYEQHPDEHPLWGIEQLQSLGVKEEIVSAIAAHYPAKTGIEPNTAIQRYLFACDELSGFITACVYVRPSRSIHDLEPKSVVKKLKTAQFAAGVSRDDVARGVELIDSDLTTHLSELIEAMRKAAPELGLQGDTPTD